MSWLFISDLHLGPEMGAVNASFVRLLTRASAQFSRLFILGDLFESWVGDDDDSPWLQPLEQALQRWTASGRALLLQQGNRDFLLGSAWTTRCAAQLLAEEVVYTLPDGQATLLMHGDSLCTDDVAYQNFRRQVRQPTWQATVLAQPLAQRHELARALRAQSRQAQANQAANITDVQGDAVRAALQRHQVTRLIHGHTHRPACHRLQSLQDTDTPSWRYVCGDWNEHGQALVLSADVQGLHCLFWDGENFTQTVAANLNESGTEDPRC